MKRILILPILILSLTCFGQADTVVTSLNLRASVLNASATFLKDHPDPHAFNALLKFSVDFRDGTIPNDNSNVNIDTVYTDILISMYSFLRENIYTQTAFDDFASDINSKRNTNTRLDTGCDDIDSRFAAGVLRIAVAGKKFLVGK